MCESRVENAVFDGFKETTGSKEVGFNTEIPADKTEKLFAAVGEKLELGEGTLKAKAERMGVLAAPKLQVIDVMIVAQGALDTKKWDEDLSAGMRS